MRRTAHINKFQRTRAARREKMVRVVEMILVGTDPSDKARSFLLGEPLMQKCHRIAWKFIFGRWKNCSNPIIYDPSTIEKAAFHLAVRAAMEELAIFPTLTVRNCSFWLLGYP
jgi:hypothetical protein